MAAASAAMQVFPLRIHPGEDLTRTLQQFVANNNLKAAFILTCVGSVKSVNLRFATSVAGEHAISEIQENLEICSLVGTLSMDGCHLHGTFGDARGHTVSGHIMGNMIVQTTAEVVISNIVGSEFKRVFDARTGFRELTIKENEGYK